jgi:hypothetical protein
MGPIYAKHRISRYAYERREHRAGVWSMVIKDVLFSDSRELRLTTWIRIGLDADAWI